MPFDSVSISSETSLVLKSPRPSVHDAARSLRTSFMRERQTSTGFRPRDLQRSASSRVNASAAAAAAITGHLRPSPKTPRVFYPMEYGRDMRDMEIWDNTLFRSAAGRLTLTPSEHIPRCSLMLDIACGYGSWALMAAQEHPDCQIIGLDKAKIQPDLKRLGLDDLAQRVTWVHGDMLEPLPFPDGHFDVVRTELIGLCVPETKWGELFEEIARVLKPGGVFETRQEALIFPCPRFAPREASTDQRSPHTMGSSDKIRAEAELADTDPRDHSRLKEAYDAALEVRFLNPKIIATLPFYMNAHFTNVHMTPTIRFMMPPSSFIRSPGETPTGDAAEAQLFANESISVSDVLQMEPQMANSEVTIGYGGNMHLTQTMHNVLACKEAIWEQFEVLNPSLTRLDFECLMRNWELDMRDRIDMRGTLRAGLGWDPPVGPEDPEHKLWRENMVKLHKDEGLWDAQPIPEACRAVRAFMGAKPRND